MKGTYSPVLFIQAGRCSFNLARFAPKVRRRIAVLFGIKRQRLGLSECLWWPGEFVVISCGLSKCRSLKNAATGSHAGRSSS